MKTSRQKWLERTGPAAERELTRTVFNDFARKMACAAGLLLGACYLLPAAEGLGKQATQEGATFSAVETNSATRGHLTSNTPLDDKHQLAVGDRLSFRIEEDQEDPKPLVVTDSGELEVPYIGRVPAEGKTCQELAAEIKAALEKEYYYHAKVVLAVDLKARTRGRVYIVGPVRTPGPQEIPSDETLTLSKALLRAGGFNDFADRHNVKVTRQVGGAKGEKKILVVDVAQIFDKGKLELDLPLEPGDLILVPERLVRF